MKWTTVDNFQNFLWVIITTRGTITIIFLDKVYQMTKQQFIQDTWNNCIYSRSLLNVWLPKPFWPIMGSGREKSFELWTDSSQRTSKKHTPASPRLSQIALLHEPSFNYSSFVNEVPVTDFDPTFTDSLTDQQLSDGNDLNANIRFNPAKGEFLRYIPLNFENDVRSKTLIVTGAYANAMPAVFHELLETQCPISNSELLKVLKINMKVASGCIVNLLTQMGVWLKVNEDQFEDVFFCYLNWTVLF